ncbi:MAG TPA: biotin--[acetyl-CoA-carboxylase] ligase [Candidatus Dormibacteraeota bacterium]|nr:biotin--[acetyl-CoA-carboxylase] ligase [Candidatus Dormibacteraeota bacterium]
MNVIRVGTVLSTQDVARPLPVGTVVLAEHQTEGRGRLGRRWEAPPGSAFLASWVMPAHALAPIAAGVAAATACGERTRLKWPNDLLLDGRKLGGILVERVARKCVVGTGINLHWAPSGAAQLNMDRERLLVRMEPEMTRWFAASEVEVMAAWRLLSDTLGRRVRVELPGETFEGVAEDLASDGSLIVAGRPVVAGDVIHLRPGDHARQPRPRPPKRP